MRNAEHFLHSSQREALLEHLFCGEVMKWLWLHRHFGLEILQPEVDCGYDLVFELGSVVRHVQLKAAQKGSSVSAVSVNQRLADKLGGCVIIIEFDPGTLALGPYYWFGGAPGERLPDLEGFPLAKHARANAQGVKRERPSIRRIRKTQFERLDTLDLVMGHLFGAEHLRASQLVASEE